LAVDPADPNTVYVGFAGISKTTDGGATWSDLNTGLANHAVRALAIDPLNSSTVYSATDAGILKSLDAGAHWVLVNDGLPQVQMVSVAINPSQPGTLFAGLSDHAVGPGSGIYKSTDAGGHWSYANWPGGATSFAFDRSNSNLIYEAESGGFTKSTDGGTTWRQ